MWIYLSIILVMLTMNHFWMLWVRNKILASIEQPEPIGEVQLWVLATYNQYRLPIFARRRDFYADVIFTEKMIFIFRMLKLGPIKLHNTIYYLVKRTDDLPPIHDFWFLRQTDMFYKIDALLLDGRRVMIECSYISRPTLGFFKCREHKFLFPDLRDNDAYKNVLLLHRHFHQNE